MAAEIRILINQQSSGSAIADTTKDVEKLGETAEKSGSGFSAMHEVAIGALREIGSALTDLAIGGFNALAGAVSDGIADARENAKIQAQTAAVIKSTGNAAGVTAEQVAGYATALSAASGASLFGDSQIQESTNLLMTFTNIKSATLEAATAISVDMAQALGGAPKDSAIQLGKALNDPIKGVTALTRVGVTFSQEQKDMIQALVDTGDVAGAQQVILGELSKEFGGSAAAAAAADGGWAQFNDRMGEAKEAIGTAILPLLGILAGVLNDTIAPAIEAVAASFSAWLSDPVIQTQLQAIGTAIQTGIGAAFTFLTQVAIPTLIAAWNTIAPALQPVLATFTDAQDPVQGFIDVVSLVSPMLGALLSITQAVLPQILAIIQAVLTTASTYFQQHGADMVAQFQTTWTTLQATVQELTAAISSVIQAFLAQIMIFWQAHGTEIMAFVGSVWAQINEIIQLALQLIQATIVPLLQGIASFIQSHSTEIQLIFTVVWESIKAIINAALAIIRGVLQTALALFKGDWQGAWDAIKTMASTVWENLKTIFTINLAIIQTLWNTIWTAIKGAFEQILDGIVGYVIQTVLGIANAIRNFGTQAAGAAASLGGAIVSGIADGIRNGADAIVSAAKNAAMEALNAAKHALGISSPSLVFNEQVGVPMAQGMAAGLMSGAPMVAQAAQVTAGAAVQGGRSVTRNFHYQPTINNFGGAAEALDFSTANALAGV